MDVWALCVLAHVHVRLCLCSRAYSPVYTVCVGLSVSVSFSKFFCKHTCVGVKVSLPMFALPCVSERVFEKRCPLWACWRWDG